MTREKFMEIANDNTKIAYVFGQILENAADDHFMELAEDYLLETGFEFKNEHQREMFNKTFPLLKQIVETFGEELNKANSELNKKEKNASC